MIQSRISRLLTYALVLSLPLWMANCGDKGSGSTVTPVTIEGNWKITAAKMSPGVDIAPLGKVTDLLAAFTLSTQSTCLVDAVFTFRSDGTLTTNNPASCKTSAAAIKAQTGLDVAGSSKWAMSGNQLTITNSDGSKQAAATTLTATTMTWVYQGAVANPTTGAATQQEVTIDFKKQ